MNDKILSPSATHSRPWPSLVDAHSNFTFDELWRLATEKLATSTVSETVKPNFDAWWAAQGKTTFSFSEQSSYRSWCSLAWKAAQSTPSATRSNVDTGNVRVRANVDTPSATLPTMEKPLLEKIRYELMSDYGYDVTRRDLIAQIDQVLALYVHSTSTKEKS